MSKHTISGADDLFVGNGFDARLHAANGRAGVPVALLTKVSLGTPALADDDLLIDDATSDELPDAADPGETVTYTTADDGTGPLDNADTPAVSTIVTADGSSASVWALDVPRNLSAVVTHASAIVAMTVTVTGYDTYKRKLVETLTVTATGTSKTVVGNKAFAYVESIAITAAADASGNTLKLGTGAKLGLPYKLAAIGDLVALWVGSVLDTASATVVAAVTTTATATTGDTRGTVTTNEALDGAKAVTAWMHVADPSSAAGLRGVDQYAG
jgi:hypothetical protein